MFSFTFLVFRLSKYCFYCKLMLKAQNLNYYFVL